MDWTHALIGSLGGLLGAALPIIFKFVLDSKKATSQISIEERKALFNEAQKIRSDLMQEIITLRERVVTLQENNLKYAIENAELRVEVRELKEENSHLQTRVNELEGQVKSLQQHSA